MIPSFGPIALRNHIVVNKSFSYPQDHFDGPRKGFSSDLFNKIFKSHGMSAVEVKKLPVQHQNKESFIKNAHDLLEEG